MNKNHTQTHTYNTTQHTFQQQAHTGLQAKTEFFGCEELELLHQSEACIREGDKVELSAMLIMRLNAFPGPAQRVQLRRSVAAHCKDLQARGLDSPDFPSALWTRVQQAKRMV
jgi:hypothetical protein